MNTLFYIALRLIQKYTNLIYLFLFALLISSVYAVDQKEEGLQLYTAAKNGQLSIVRMMLAKGVSADAKNAYGRTALMGAVYNKNYNIIHELLLEGVDVNAADTAGQTALMLAVIKQDQKIINDLVYAGANVSAKNKSDKTAIDLAEKIGNKELSKLLKKLEK